MGGMIGLDDDIKGHARELEIAQRVAGVLDKHYAGHLWAVNVDIENGIATIYNLRLSGNWGFVLHLKQLLVSQKEADALVMRSGGELLERYHLRRGKYEIDRYSQLHEDTAGHLVAEQ